MALTKMTPREKHDHKTPINRFCSGAGSIYGTPAVAAQRRTTDGKRGWIDENDYHGNPHSARSDVYGFRAQRLPAFLPMQPMPQPAIDFFGALAATGYMIRLIFFGQLIGGVLLLMEVAVPLGLVVLAPIVVNILLFSSVSGPRAGWQSHLLWSLWKFFSRGATRRLRPAVQVECTFLNASYFLFYSIVLWAGRV
jgi:hypothetical protein